MFKMATPQKFQFRMTKGWQNIWFRRTNEVHYIGALFAVRTLMR